MGMVLDCIPVIPRTWPMVQLDGGRFATSDLNDPYAGDQPEQPAEEALDLGRRRFIVNNEKRMLPEAVDALFDTAAAAGRSPARQTARSSRCTTC